MGGVLKKVLTILAILLIGMLLLYTVINILFPNLMDQMIGNVETSIKNATSFEIDIDGNGTIGVPTIDRDTTDDNKTYSGDQKVEGWGGGESD